MRAGAFRRELTPCSTSDVRVRNKTRVNNCLGFLCFFVCAHESCGCRDEAHSGLNMVLVEGGPKAVRAYVKLMTLRIRWGEEEYGGGDSDSDRSVRLMVCFVFVLVCLRNLMLLPCIGVW